MAEPNGRHMFQKWKKWFDFCSEVNFSPYKYTIYKTNTSESLSFTIKFFENVSIDRNSNHTVLISCVRSQIITRLHRLSTDERYHSVYFDHRAIAHNFDNNHKNVFAGNKSEIPKKNFFLIFAAIFSVSSRFNFWRVHLQMTSLLRSLLLHVN